MGLVARPFIALASALDRRIGWYRLPRVIGLFVLDGVRARLRRENLHDVYEGRSMGPDVQRPKNLDARTIEGFWNDVERSRAGSVGTRFGRNGPRRWWTPETLPGLLDPNPRLVSRELLTREKFIPAKCLNVLAAAWIQFEVHDWIEHAPDLQAPPYEVPIDGKNDDWPESPMRIRRSQRDPLTGHGAPPAFFTRASHWWDGSQIYGADKEFARRLRTGEDGKLRIDENTKLPPPDLDKGLDLAGVAGNFWVGLGILHTLFMREHNAICEQLKRAYPTWKDERLYQTARLVNAAVMAKIHTVEWTTAIIANPTTVWGMRASWYGLLGERFTNRFGRVGRGDLLSGIPGSRTDDHGVQFSLTEEFAAVYRMHPLLPDEYAFRSAADGKEKARYRFSDLGVLDTRKRLEELGVADIFYSFGVAHPGALVLHNFPSALQNLTRQDKALPHVDLAATDLVRIRESAVPRYNDFRRLFHLKPAASFEEVTGESVEAAKLREIYGYIERLDLMVGLYAEPPPPGFGFSDTAFRVFLLMASRRLKSDRFFTNDFTPDVYTPEGLDWIKKATMVKLLRDHYPELRPRLQRIENAFKPWEGPQA